MSRSATRLERLFGWPDHLDLQIATIATLAVIVVLARQASMPPMGPYVGDSFYFISAAWNLVIGRGLYDFAGDPLISWPPLYPLLLAASGLGVFHPLRLAGPLNAILLGLTVFFVGRYLRHRLQSPFLVAWTCMALALAVPLVDVAARVVAESLFILLATLTLIWTDRFLDHGRKSALFGAATFAALTWQTSYLGVTVAIAAALVLLWRRGLSSRRTAGEVAIFLLVATTPAVLLWLHNYLLGGTFIEASVDMRRWADLGVWDVVVQGASAVCGWLDFDLPLLEWPRSTALDIAVVIALLALLGVLIAAIWRRVAGRPAAKAPLDLQPYWLFGGFALAYLVLHVAAVGFRFPLVDPALAYSPLYIPILLTVVFLLDWFLSHDRETNFLGRFGDLPFIGPLVRGDWTRRSVFADGLAIALSLWVAGQVVPNALAIDSERWEAEDADLRPPRGIPQSGEGGTPVVATQLRAPRWGHSQTLHHLRENPLDGSVYSNQLDIVVLNNTGKATYLPLGDDFSFGSLDERLGEAPEGAYVVWFRNHYDRVLFGDLQLRIRHGFEPVAELTDGVIFKVNSAYAPAQNDDDSIYERFVAGDVGEPVERSRFDIYFDSETVIYFKRPCAVGDVREMFFLQYTTDRGDIHGENFHFGDRGVVYDSDTCVATFPLQDLTALATGDVRPIHARTGQFSSTGDLWWVELDDATLNGTRDESR